MPITPEKLAPAAPADEAERLALLASADFMVAAGEFLVNLGLAETEATLWRVVERAPIVSAQLAQLLASEFVDMNSYKHGDHPLVDRVRTFLAGVPATLEDGYPPLPAGSTAYEFDGEAVVYEGKDMHAYVAADRALRGQCKEAAVNTLQSLGYTYHGAEQWKPPTGKAPDFDLVDQLRGRIAQLEAEQAAVRQAVRGYHSALDARAHGGVATSWALDEIQTALGMHWGQVAEEATPAAPTAAPAAVAVPDGWKLVPVQDTQSMWTAGGRAIKSCAGHERDAASLAYKAMLAAAPALAATPPAQAQAAANTQEKTMPFNSPIYEGVRAAVQRDMHAGAAWHSDTVAVYRFADEMAAKMEQARAKGRGGWETCPPEVLSSMLREHVEKGDPRDVANFCMMLWHLGQPIAPAPQAQDVQRDAARVSLPIHWMKELVALCGPEDHELRDRVLKSLERLPLAHAGKLDELNKGEVLVVVTGYTGTGKSAVAGEIEIMCRALGLEVEWPGGDSEKNMTHADWTAALEQYRPRVRIVERNVPGPIAAQAAQGEA